MSSELMTVEKWYGTSLPVPRYNSKNYGRFLAASLGIVRSVLNDELGKRIRIRFRAVATAQADWEKCEITINHEFLTGRIVPGTPQLKSEMTIAVIMGIVVHEAAHFAFSPSTLRPFAEYVEKRTTCQFIESLALLLGNIVEDIYIEAEVERKVPSLSWTLTHANNVFFGKEKEASLLADSASVVAPPISLEQVALVLNALILAKTREEIYTNPFITKLFYRIRNATVLSTLPKRQALVLDIYNQLMRDVILPKSKCEIEEEEEEEEESSGSGLSVEGEGRKKETPDEKRESEEEEEEEGEGKEEEEKEESEEEEGEGKEEEEEEESEEKEEEEEEDALEKIEEELRKLSKQARGLTADLREKATLPTGPVPSIPVADIEQQLNVFEESSFSLAHDDKREGSNMLYVEAIPPLGERLESDEKYEKLAEVGRQKATINRPYGLDRNRGTHIRKLYRIATDQKIFAETVQMSGYRPMQVIILIDCSGSMRSGSPTNIYRAAQAALGAAKGLIEARCDVAVYGHTAFVTGLEEVTIYKGKEFSESLSVLPERLGGLVNHSQLRENMDGYAIHYVGKKFTARDKRRLMIVISDGIPAAPDYCGLDANNHVRAMVNEVRSRGVEVLSISITEFASVINEYIYGREWNVRDDDPNVIEKIVRSLLEGDTYGNTVA